MEIFQNIAICVNVKCVTNIELTFYFVIMLRTLPSNTKNLFYSLFIAWIINIWLTTVYSDHHDINIPDAHLVVICFINKVSYRKEITIDYFIH